MGILSKAFLASMALAASVLYAQDEELALDNSQSLSKSEQLKLEMEEMERLQETLGIDINNIDDMGISKLVSQYRSTGNLKALDQLALLAKEHEVTHIAISQAVPIDDNTIPLLIQIAQEGRSGSGKAAIYKLGSVKPEMNLSTETLLNIKTLFEEIMGDMNNNLAPAASGNWVRLQERKVFDVTASSEASSAPSSPSSILYWGFSIALVVGAGYLVYRRRA